MIDRFGAVVSMQKQQCVLSFDLQGVCLFSCFRVLVPPPMFLLPIDVLGLGLVSNAAFFVGLATKLKLLASLRCFIVKL